MTDEMKETLRTYEISRQKNAWASPGLMDTLGAVRMGALVEELCFLATFFHSQPHTEKIKPCVLIKRSKIEANCASNNLDFATIEKLAETKMSEATRSFYRECVKTSKS